MLPATKDSSISSSRVESIDANSADDLTVAEILDDACRAILRGTYHRPPMREIHLNPQVYRVVAGGKARELDRGAPLMLLGLDVVSDVTVAPDTVRIDLGPS